MAEDGIAQRWDARYRAAPAEGLFGSAPNASLVAALARPEIRPGTALMLADGDGRNSTWLAGLGVAVTAVDLSGVATERARARDRAEGVRVARHTADLATWRPEGAADLATLLYLQGPRALRRHALGLAAGALSPGGWLLLEGFALAQAPGGMGPDDPDKLWSLEDLAPAEGLEIWECLAGRVRLDEGAAHRGTAEVVRLLARRAG